MGLDLEEAGGFEESGDGGSLGGFVIFNEEMFEFFGFVFGNVEEAEAVLNEEMIGENDGGTFIAVDEKLRAHDK